MESQKGHSKAYFTALMLFLVAFGCRSAFLIWLDEPIRFDKYVFFAEKLARGESLGQRIVDLSPFYLYWMRILAPFLNGNWDAVKWIQAFVGSLVCLQTFALGTRLFGSAVGIIASLMVAMYGNLIILETTLEPTVFVLLFNAQTVYLLLTAGHPDDNGPGDRWRAPLAGLFCGLSIVTKPSFLLYLPLGMAWLLFLNRKTSAIRSRTRDAALYCVVSALVVLPVTIRNYFQLKDFVLVTADAGKVFFHGNARGATALNWTGLPDEGFLEEGAPEPDFAHVLFRQTASKLSGRELSPSESSRFWVKRTLSDIADDPMIYVGRQLKKTVFFFADYELHYIASAYKEYKKSLDYPFLRYGLISALALTGMLWAVKGIKNYFLLYAVPALYLLSGLIFIVQSRYRTPAVPYLCIFAAFSLSCTLDRFTVGRLKSAILSLLLIAAIFFFSQFSLKSEIIDTDRWQTATKLHYQLGALPLFASGRYDDAILELDACIALAPKFTPAYNLRGRAEALIGRLDAAVEDFNRVIALSPGISDGYKNAGFLYLIRGDRKAARGMLETALSLDPGDRKVNDILMQLDVQ